MALLEPKIAILDETDSGLDIDALRIVASGIKKISKCTNWNYTYYPLSKIIR